MEYQGEAWMEYDCQIRQRATTNPHISWSAIETTLWNLMFAGKTITTRCNHSFSLIYKSYQCKCAPDQLSSVNCHQLSTSQPLCKASNTDQHPGCPFANCVYNHIC